MNTKNPKILSLDDAPKIFKSNQSIFIQGGAATPHLLIDYMMKATLGLNNLEILHLHTEGNLPYLSKPNFKVTNLFVGKNVRPFINYESVDYIPCFLSEIGNLFRKKIKPVNVALIHVSRPDQHGHVSLGVSVDVAKAAVENADIVIAQINLQMPRVHGDGFISLSEIDYILECDVPLAQSPKKQLSDTELAIGKNVAALVDDQATLQLGIGAIPDAVCFHLKSHKDLGLHTEMWSHGGFELIKSGVVTNRYKNFHQGKTTSCFVMGDDEIYKFINDNLSVLTLEAGYTNTPINIMRNDRVTAINSATEIDLTGQVCSDSIGHKIISGVGGQMDFMRAAALSEHGKPILALSSLTNKGDSRIKPSLKLGAGVVTTRSHVHYVVTEIGSVNLYGKTIGQRAKLLLSISHPSVREQLERDWFELIKK